jgi:hypothetical protein
MIENVSFTGYRDNFNPNRFKSTLACEPKLGDRVKDSSGSIWIISNITHHWTTSPTNQSIPAIEIELQPLGNR